MKSLNSQDQWTWKFALKFFLALLLNNVLFISENFLQNAIAFAQPTPQPTISYPYKLFPNQSSTDCAIGEDTDFPFDDNPEKTITTDILKWNRLEQEVWLKICEGKPFNTDDSLSHLNRKVVSWIYEYNQYNKENKTQCSELELKQNKDLVSG